MSTRAIASKFSRAFESPLQSRASKEAVHRHGFLAIIGMQKGMRQFDRCFFYCRHRYPMSGVRTAGPMSTHDGARPLGRQQAVETIAWT